jgi:hypothetical protein
MAERYRDYCSIVHRPYLHIRNYCGIQQRPASCRPINIPVIPELRDCADMETGRELYQQAAMMSGCLADHLHEAADVFLPENQVMLMGNRLLKLKGKPETCRYFCSSLANGFGLW